MTSQLRHMSSGRACLTVVFLLLCSSLVSGCLRAENDITASSDQPGRDFPTATSKSLQTPASTQPAPSANVIPPTSSDPAARPTMQPTPTPTNPLLRLEAGTYPVYWRERALYVGALDGTWHSLLAEIDDPLARLSPDGGQIVYSTGSQIIIYDLMLGLARPIAQPEAIEAGFHGWSPDGSMLSYVARTVELNGGVPQIDEYPSIFITWLEDDAFMRLTAWDSVETDPVWSPDGNWIAFAADYSKAAIDHPYAGETEIHLINTACLVLFESCADTPDIQITDLGEGGNGSVP